MLLVQAVSSIAMTAAVTRPDPRRAGHMTQVCQWSLLPSHAHIPQHEGKCQASTGGPDPAWEEYVRRLSQLAGCAASEPVATPATVAALPQRLVYVAGIKVSGPAIAFSA